MSSIAALDMRDGVRATPSTPRAVRIALLGCGNVGSAFAALAGDGSSHRMRITHALVRDCLRPRPTLDAHAERIDDGRQVFLASPDVIVELLGGIQPARTLISDALLRGIPVVTANKSLLAAYGHELRELAARTSTPLLYEAAVIAGVPFLSTFARRPHAANVTSLTGIANGTSNFILTRARDTRCGIDSALTEAQRLGYAEPDPSNDVDGVDAAEKLIVLLQHFAKVQVPADSLEISGIRNLDAADIDHAADLGGTIKPVISAEWHDGLQAFAGPAFMPFRHALASVDGAENAIVLNGPNGRLLFQGPGAGPVVTAATVMDDVVEALRTPRGEEEPCVLRSEKASSPETGWFVSATGTRLPAIVEIADLLASYGIFLRRTANTGPGRFAALTWPVSSTIIGEALASLEAAAQCETKKLRALEP